MHDPVQQPLFRPGDDIEGKYTVVRTLGQGGMGIVLLAKHRGLDELVALKFLNDEARANRDLVQRFLQEGRAAAKIKGDHCVRMLDVAVLSNGTPYMVMEYLEGVDLAHDLSKRLRLRPMDAVDHILEACVAIAEAHRLGIVHRDLKSSNLFLVPSPSGVTVKVLDFGISKMLPGGDVSRAALTQKNDVFGSPLYMSPEQMKSTGAIDQRTDIWSLAIVLYECLTGTTPFIGESMAQICAAVMTDEMPAIPPVLGIAPQLEAVRARALSKNPNGRPGSVAEFASLLLPFASARGVAAFAKMKSPRASSPSFADVPSAPGPLVSTGTDFSTTTNARSRTNVFTAIMVGLGVCGATLIAATLALKHHQPELAASPSSAPVAVASEAPPLQAVDVPPPPTATTTAEPVAAVDAGTKPVAPPRRPSRRAGFGGRD
jgi:serine/threonine-protein kinase